ncbi:NAD(P)-binding domain-containing protein [Dapis sp. BLCC M229]|uniref:NAD(P)-binding domain-containing protein n=1 Tax=Dapis sp. BLCC M229 TaxID=3400188 RepID=UPI003CEBC752
MTNKTKDLFIGTETMSRPMRFKLLEKGYTLKVQNKYNQKERVVASGGTREDYPKELTRDCRVLIACLPSENMSGKNGSIEGINKGATEKYYYRCGNMVLDFR